MEYRVEQKYMVSDAEMIFLQKQLETCMHYDKYHPNGESYMIRSVYFDDLYDSCLMENENGTDYREKFRIRTYDNKTDEIHLECKSKVHGFTKKQKQSLTYDEALCYINNERVSICNDDGFLKKKLYALQQMNHFQPVQIVEYERIAMIEEIGNVRITFDRNISGTKDVKAFFDKQIATVPALPSGYHILEVKYDELLPDQINRILRTVSLQRQAFSKYYYTRNNEMINR